jgi:hypothetical protein
MEIIIPSIKINKKIYIPMVDTIITRENISVLPVFETGLDSKGKLKINRLLEKERLKIVDQGNMEFEDVSSEPVFNMRN